MTIGIHIMKRPAVFFDRDNTLIVSNGYLGNPAEVKLIAGAAALVAQVRRLGYAAVVVSNQSGVARGMFREEDVEAVNRRMEELLSAENPEAIIERHEYCPFHPEALLEAYRKDSDLRKPKPGMILKAAQEMDLSLATSWMIGDAPRDIEAGAAAGCRTILFRDDELTASPAAAEVQRVQPDFVVGSLDDAGRIISSADFISLGDSITAPAHDNTDCGAQSPEHGETVGIRIAHDPRVPDELNRIHATLDKILAQLGKPRMPAPFSVSRLLGGVVQVLGLACLMVAIISYQDRTAVYWWLTWAIAVELLSIALLLMGRE